MKGKSMRYRRGSGRVTGSGFSIKLLVWILFDNGVVSSYQAKSLAEIESLLMIPVIIPSRPLIHQSSFHRSSYTYSPVPHGVLDMPAIDQRNGPHSRAPVPLNPS